ncbi:hypothetical protein DICPUDRAFT_147906 [Dictyostelium purpureum]|uniref:Uncharacterized protein n=1 Tax=Dictyostelium purpureum TaxID=5786 RepID=F0Z9Q7_DICPU|nr:uncharacterized protein DICPUDRAFT_147906 [Dictyostelium purpureum]EGC39365.1 hypothetical protein DICPUDRAFT_147906 [Dictyostelium purpureum]|eukprot:XP_003284153.1 hypothetical protein DICPUDRAFT_147906 [Dictyostelium purpureum]
MNHYPSYSNEKYFDDYDVNEENKNFNRNRADSFVRTQVYSPIIEPLHYDENDLNIIELAGNNLTTHSQKSAFESPFPNPLNHNNSNSNNIKKSQSSTSFSSNRNQSSYEYSNSYSSNGSGVGSKINMSPSTSSNSLKGSNSLKRTNIILNDIPEHSVLDTPTTNRTADIIYNQVQQYNKNNSISDAPPITTTTTTTTTKNATKNNKSKSLDQLPPIESKIAEKKQSSFKKNIDSFFNEINDLEIADTSKKQIKDTTVTTTTTYTPGGKDKLRESRSIKKNQIKSNPSSNNLSLNRRSLSIMGNTLGDTGPIPNVEQPSMFSIKDTHNIFDYKKPVISANTKVFITCLKRVLIDKDRIMERNDQSLRTVIYKLCFTIKKLHQDGILNILFDDIRLITEIIIRSGYFIQIFRSFFKLVDEVKTSEVFFSFLSECRHMAEIINLIIKAAGHGNESQTRKMIYIEEDHRKILLKQIKYLIQILLQNEELTHLVKNIANLKRQVDIAKEEQRKAFTYDLRKNLHVYAPFTNEVICAAQSIVGEKVNLRTVFSHLNQAINYVKNNRTYKKVIKDLSDIIRRIYSTEESNLTIELETQTRQAMDRLEVMIIEICSLPPLVEVRVQLSLLISAFMSDPINERLIHDIKDLFNSMKSEKIGKKIDINIFRELKLLIFPYLIHNIHKFGLPNIEGQKEKKKIEYRLENINLILTKIDPNDLNIKLISSVETAPLVLKGCIKSILSIELTNVHFKLEQVAWHFKKSSFPKIKDSGLVNISTGEKGVDIKLKLSFSPNILENKHCFQIIKSKCKINDIHINILNSSHNGLYKTIYKLFKKKIKKSIEDAISEELSAKIMNLDKYIYDLFIANDKPKVDKTSIKSMNKAKREKILERIVTEIPTSTKSSRRFSILSFNYGQPNSPLAFDTPKSTSSRRSLDTEIDEFILKEQQRERSEDEENRQKRSLGHEFRYEFSPSPLHANSQLNNGSSDSQLQRRLSQPDLYNRNQIN